MNYHLLPSNYYIVQLLTNLCNSVENPKPFNNMILQLLVHYDSQLGNHIAAI